MHSKGSYFMRHSIRNLLESTVLYDSVILVVYIYEGSTFIHNSHIHNTLKELDVFVRSEHRSKVTDILRKIEMASVFSKFLVPGVHQVQHQKWYIHTDRVELLSLNS